MPANFRDWVPIIDFIMTKTIHNRLATLRAEYDKGQERLRDLHREEIELRETLLRIEGAMMVLSEMTRSVSAGEADTVDQETPSPASAP